MLISPSILAADYANLERDVRAAAHAGADLLHVDVMDGHFVPNISIGAPVVASLRKLDALPLDVHLMIENPSKYVDMFCDAGAAYLTIHLEAPDDKPTADTLRSIRARGVKAGLSIKPKTPVAAVRDLLPLCDMLLVMTVEPGFGGQKFIDGSTGRIAEAKSLARALSPDCLIEIDGGVDETNVAVCRDAGADIAVMGSALFRGDVGERMKLMRSVLNK